MDGIINVWKEKGMTSHDVVAKLRGMLKTRKVGHTGTLDPEVQGVLPICVGAATKLVQLLIEKEKTYIGVMRIGVATDTEDLTGQIINQVKMKEPLGTDQIDQAMASFIGLYPQVPPMYSAVKVNGRKLYEYARAGEKVERPVREVQIYHFDRIDDPYFNAEEGYQEVAFSVRCSKGTYVRTLLVDCANILGYPGTMADLTRIQSGPYEKETALKLSEIQAMVDEENYDFLQSLETVFPVERYIPISEEIWDQVKNGQKIETVLEQEPEDGLYPLTYQGHLKAIYHADPKSDLIRPFIMTLKNGEID